MKKRVFVALVALGMLTGCAGLAKFFAPSSTVQEDGTVVIGPSPADELGEVIDFLPSPWDEVGLLALTAFAFYARQRAKKQPSPEQEAENAKLREDLAKVAKSG